MKSFNRLIVITIVFIALILLGVNLYLTHTTQDGSRPYRVEILHAADEIRQNGISSLSLDDYPSIVAIQTESSDDFYSGNRYDYLIQDINGTLYRFDYVRPGVKRSITDIAVINSILVLFSIVIICVLFYIKKRLLTPFHELKELPFELTKGNLNIPLKENKNRLFGRFVWGMNLLRENMEEQKIREIAMQKEKKTLILSLSHDIKTPLSAIKLYSRALSGNLYKDPEKQHDIAVSIQEKTDEIENYVSQIIQASREDFLQLDVKSSEFYLSACLNPIITYYTEKLRLVHTDFLVDSFSDCILKGDCDRSIEVLQNLMENAMKYGDGHTISISVKKEEGCRLVTVTSSGNPPSDNEMDHIFDSFYRGSNTGSQPGSGLGLYICRQILQKMNGEIFASAEEGAFRVTAVFSEV